MTPLARKLARRIAKTGPITVADYMAECLLDPQHGYYAIRDPLGSQGDFITAPEISQMFGEIIGLCLAQSWIDQGRPAPFVLAELGPGRGTLMSDILRACARVPGFTDGATIELMEASPALRAKQRDMLEGHRVRWIDDVASLSDLPLFLAANEFFDALPVRQFVRDTGGWRERHIGQDGDRLTFGLSAPAPIALLDHRLDDTKTGDMVEHCPALPRIASELSRRVAARGGVAIFVDYGDWRSLGDTFQAVRDHQTEDPLAASGDADLTAHVDFEALAYAAAPARATRMTPQGVFLERLGITARAQALARNLGGDALESHVAAHRRLTHPDEMGSLFKTLAYYPQGAPMPPGFD